MYVPYLNSLSWNNKVTHPWEQYLGHDLDHKIGVMEIEAYCGMIDNYYFLVTLPMGTIHGSDPSYGGNTHDMTSWILYFDIVNIHCYAYNITNRFIYMISCFIYCLNSYIGIFWNYQLNFFANLLGIFICFLLQMNQIPFVTLRW